MRYYDSMQDLIGNTPLVKLNHLGLPEGVQLFAKLELYNPGGSVKDRPFSGYAFIHESSIRSARSGVSAFSSARLPPPCADTR